MKNSLESLAGSLGLNAGINNHEVTNIKVNPDLHAVYAAESMEAQKDLEGFVLLMGIANEKAGPEYSTEGFKETMSKFWEKVKEFFKKIGRFFKKLWLRFASLFSKKAKMELMLMDVAEEFEKAMKDPEIDKMARDTAVDVTRVFSTMAENIMNSTKKENVPTPEPKQLLSMPAILVDSSPDKIIDKMTSKYNNFHKLDIPKQSDTYIDMVFKNTPKEKLDEYLESMKNGFNSADLPHGLTDDDKKDVGTDAFNNFNLKMSYSIKLNNISAIVKSNITTYEKDLKKIEKQFDSAKSKVSDENQIAALNKGFSYIAPIYSSMSTRFGYFLKDVEFLKNATEIKI